MQFLVPSLFTEMHSLSLFLPSRSLSCLSLLALLCSLRVPLYSRFVVLVSFELRSSLFVVFISKLFEFTGVCSSPLVTVPQLFGDISSPSPCSIISARVSARALSFSNFEILVFDHHCSPFISDFFQFAGVLLLVFIIAIHCSTVALLVPMIPNLPYKAVNLGNWLLAEGWMKPSLFDGIANKDILL
ncbi:uncharacterized protein DS421_15g520370 [Arachis hypogaea]|nr:uncharacterized protein DS421_15g520370 [Arachis hypogaea]